MNLLRCVSPFVTLAALAGPALARPSQAPRVAGARAAGHQPTLRFRFNAGAPLLAAAAVAPDGTVLVGAEDGYVHALRADGSYRWSLSLRGAVAHAPLPAPEHFYVATTADRIYAVNPDGSLAWFFAAPAGIESELCLAPNGLVYFTGRDRHLYGLTAHGSVALRLPVGEVSAGPVIAPDGDVWVGTSQGDLVRARLAGNQRVAVGAPVLAAFNSGGALYWLAGQEQLRAGPSGAPAYRLPDIAWTAGTAAVTVRGDCVWLDAQGSETVRLSPCARAGAAPALGSQNELLVPMDDGALVVATPRGISRIQLAASPLLAPSWSPTVSLAIASAREGLVSGVAL